MNELGYNAMEPFLGPPKLHQTKSDGLAESLLGLLTISGNHHGQPYNLTRGVSGTFISVQPNPSGQENNRNHQFC